MPHFRSSGITSNSAICIILRSIIVSVMKTVACYTFLCIATCCDTWPKFWSWRSVLIVGWQHEDWIALIVTYISTTSIHWVCFASTLRTYINSIISLGHKFVAQPEAFCLTQNTLILYLLNQQIFDGKTEIIILFWLKVKASVTRQSKNSVHVGTIRWWCISKRRRCA